MKDFICKLRTYVPMLLLLYYKMRYRLFVHGTATEDIFIKFLFNSNEVNNFIRF